GRNRARTFRVPHDDIGVGTNADGAFARIDIEDLRRVGGRDAGELIHGKPPRVYTGGPQHRQAILDARTPVGNLREVRADHGLLIGAEAAVIGSGGLQVTRLQAAPQRVLVIFGAEWRAHDVAGRSGPVLVA